MKRFFFISLCVVLIVLIGVSIGSAAQSRKGTISISTGIGGYHFECNQCYLEDAESFSPTFSIGLGIGYNLTDQWTTELLLNYINAEYDNNDVDTYLYRFNVLYNLPMMDGKLIPFLSAGLGAINFDSPDDGSSADFLVNYGAGLNYYLTERLALRGDISHLITFNPSYNNLLYTIGASYLIGGAKKEAPKPPDTDGDGVIDDNDKCPGTPAGVTVDAVGCPLDSDKDGVYDYLDKCPETPQGVAVDAVGCPPDRDGDGFADYLDKCPDVPGPGTVDGCPVPVEEAAPVVRMRLNVEFDTDKADVKTVYHDEIGKLAEVLKKYPETTAVVEGHTDNRGSDNFNLLLSQRRADSVRQYLIDKFGIDEARIKATGYGETRPIADNATDQGRLANRRVEAEIEYKAK